ncbi:MAG: hypothetical protein C5B60_03940 [Chloroflexi bacterium]|nr:MAG: hypothetical protein C5B60_03940 [Chloroflexota bacterium]
MSGKPNTLTAGTLTTAQYTASYGYDTLDRLSSSPTGTYTYGDSAHLHAVTAIGSSYGAKYDAAGSLTWAASKRSAVEVDFERRQGIDNRTIVAMMYGRAGYLWNGKPERSARR